MYLNWREKMDASISSTPGLPESRCGRKRLQNEENWKRKKRKLLKDKGKSYTTSKGSERNGEHFLSVH